MQNMEYHIKQIEEINRTNLSTIKYLKRENVELKDEHYKDTELSTMKRRLEEMKKDYWRGFPISKEEEHAIEEWKKRHDEQDHGYTPEMRIKAEGCCGGRYKYVFVPTSIGVSGKIVCHCGAEFEFQEIG